MMHNYYTVASKEYTYKILLLYNSMMRYDKSFRFFIVCLHSESRKIFEGLGLQNAVLIDIEALETYDGELVEVKKRRSTKQYAWAAKPVAALYILEYYHEVDHIVWLDGDTLFLSSPEPIYEEWGDYPVALTEEKFTGKYEDTAKIYGFYNTGFMGFRRSEGALECLRYFRERMMEWNYDEKEQYRWNDQLYVSDWPQRFGNIGIIKNPGVNMTPFIFNRLLEEDKSTLSEKTGCLYMGDIKIVLFHFYGFNYFNRNEFELCGYTDIYNQAEIKQIYIPYIKDSIRAIEKIRGIEKEYCEEQPVVRAKLRNYFYLDLPGQKNQNNGKGLKGRITFSINGNIGNRMKSGIKGD